MDTTKVVEKIKFGNIDLSLKTLNLQNKTVIPSIEDFNVLPDEQYGGLSSITVKGVTNEIDDNIKPENILDGVDILGVKGNLLALKPFQDKSFKPDAEGAVIQSDEGFALGRVIVEPVPTEELKIFSNSSTEYHPSEGMFIDKVIVDIGGYDSVTVFDGVSFTTSTKFFQFDDDVLFLVDNGVWRCNISQNEWTKLSDIGESVFQKINDSQCLMGGSTKGLRLYDKHTDSISAIDGAENIVLPLFVKSGFKWLVSSGSTTSTYAGIFVYDSVAKTTTKIYDTGSYWGVGCEFQNGAVLASSNSSYKGLLRFDNNTNEISLLRETGYGSFKYIAMEHKILIVGGTGGGVGVYNVDTNELTALSTADFSGSVINYVIIKNRCVLTRSTEFAIYDIDDDSWTTSKPSYSGYSKLEVVGDSCFLICTTYYSTTTSEGIYLYTYDDNAINRFYYGGYNWVVSPVVNGKCLLAAGDSSGAERFVSYDIETKTKKELSQYSNTYTKMFVVGDKIFALGGTRIWVYDSILDTTRNRLQVGNYAWNKMTKISDTLWQIESTAITQPFVLLYDSVSDSLSLHKLKLGG